VNLLIIWLQMSSEQDLSRVGAPKSKDEELRLCFQLQQCKWRYLVLTGLQLRAESHLDLNFSINLSAHFHQ